MTRLIDDVLAMKMRLELSGCETIKLFAPSEDLAKISDEIEAETGHNLYPCGPYKGFKFAGIEFVPLEQ